jgi:hypothetical protein
MRARTIAGKIGGAAAHYFASLEYTQRRGPEYWKRTRHENILFAA